MNETSKSHDQTVIELLREALLFALRHIAEAQGMAVIAERAGIKRESLYRACPRKETPRLKHCWP